MPASACLVGQLRWSQALAVVFLVTADSVICCRFRSLGERLDGLLCAICRGGEGRESARGGLTRIGAALRSRRSTLWRSARQWLRRVGSVERSWSLPALPLRWLASRSHRLTFRPRMKRFGCFSVAVTATTLSLMGRWQLLGHVRLGYVLLGIGETLCLPLVRHANLDLLHEHISNL